MAIRYKPDLKLAKAKEFVNNLDPVDEGNELTLYYIQDLKAQLFNAKMKLGEYKLFFKTLESLMPKHPKTLGS